MHVFSRDFIKLDINVTQYNLITQARNLGQEFEFVTRAAKPEEVLTREERIKNGILGGGFASTMEMIDVVGRAFPDYVMPRGISSEQ